MKREERIVGTGFTRRRIINERTETPEEFEAGLREMVRRAQNPWEGLRPRRKWIEEALEQEKAQLPTGASFREREDAGWYLAQLKERGELADHAIAKNDAIYAAHHAVFFGELWAEFELKLVREELFLFGQKHRTNLEAANANRRRGMQADRVAQVDAMVARGLSKRNAFARIAKAEGSSAKAVETDYYKARKTVPQRLD